MKSGIKKAVFYALSFAIPCLAYLLIWKLTKQATCHRIGYLLWLNASIEGPLGVIRIKLVEIFFQFVLPILAGAAGLWGARLRMRRRNS